MNIQTLFRPRINRELERLVEESKILFSTKKGTDQLIRAIMRTENPLDVSEYAFEIESNEFIDAVKYCKERKEFLKKIFENGGLSEEDKKKILEFKNSAYLKTTALKNPIYHVHPRYSLDELRNNNRPDYSNADKNVSRKLPVGLIEYCMKDATQGQIDLSARLSICYKTKAKIISNIKIRLNSKGLYIATDEEIEQSGQVPKILRFSGVNFDKLVELDLGDKLKNYFLRHCTTQM